jgi:hypothetical protein
VRFPPFRDVPTMRCQVGQSRPSGNLQRAPEWPGSTDVVEKSRPLKRRKSRNSLASSESGVAAMQTLCAVGNMPTKEPAVEGER